MSDSNDSSDLITTLAQQTGLSPGQVQGMCGDMLAMKYPQQHENLLALCSTWGAGYREAEMLVLSALPNLGAITKGITGRGVMITGRALARCSEKLEGNDVDAALKFAKLAKTTNDIAVAWERQPVAVGGQHVHFHGQNQAELVRLLKEQRTSELPAAARLAARGVEVGGGGE